MTKGHKKSAPLKGALWLVNNGARLVIRFLRRVKTRRSRLFLEYTRGTRR